jgi:uroporphyrinogen-III decarboxylase
MMTDDPSRQIGADEAGPAADGPGGFAPHPLFFERMQRLQTAIACGTPDRVPISLVMDLFAANAVGASYTDYVSSVDRAAEIMLAALEKLGDVDSLQFPTYAPDVLGMLWLAPMKLPGRDLPEHTQWQMDEQVRLQPEDYDRILDMGWSAWLGQYIGKYLHNAVAAAQALQEAGPRWTMEYMRRGYAILSPLTVDHPFEHLAGARTVKEFTLDLFRMPDKIQAVMDVIMAEKREQTRALIRAVGQPTGYWVGSWRTAPEFLSPKLWDRFVWPYMKELVEIVAEEGGTPVLHYDANWDREIERLRDLPARRCILELDGKTDIFRAKKILAGHMCILGDVHPALLSLGTVDEVKAYCKRLLTEVGPDGYIMAMGCAVPPDAKFENVKAMVDSVHEV